jgi:hypothetical protein
MADAIEGQGIPAPWPWQYCRFCMDIRNGTFLNWPMGPLLKDNKKILEMMQITWRTWRHVGLTSNAKYKWTAGDVLFEDWLNEGRPQLPEPLSDAEQWAIENGYS